eukprot:12424237-Heterocapsa_arctica.AAC.1
MFKQGGYRAFPNYIARAKDQHIAESYVWTDDLQRAYRRAQRSVLRGIGPARQSAALSLSVVVALPASPTPASDTAPLNADLMFTFAALFMLREIE